MSLSLNDYATPRNARAIEARWFALPAAIKDKLAKIEAGKDMLHAACETLRSRALTLREKIAEKRRRLDHAIANASPERTVPVSGFTWAGVPGNAVARVGGAPGPERQQEIDFLADELARLEPLAKEAQRRWEATARVYQNARDWMEATELAAVVPRFVKYERLIDAPAEIESIRTKLAALAQEAEVLERAPVPVSEALQRLDTLARDVEARVAARREAQVRGFFAPSGVRDVAVLFGLVQGFAESPRELAEAIRERCETDFLAEQKTWKEAIRAQAVNGESVSSFDRPKRLAAITRHRHELEVREEALVLSAERDGLDLDRRESAPAAVVVCTVLAEDAAA
jgi:prefoldin subunit 5